MEKKTTTKRKKMYPGTLEAEKQKSKPTTYQPEEPDFIGNAPNYDKFKGWKCEEVLVWLNID